MGEDEDSGSLCQELPTLNKLLKFIHLFSSNYFGCALPLNEGGKKQLNCFKQCWKRRVPFQAKKTSSCVIMFSLTYIYTAVLAFPSTAQCSRTVIPDVVSGLCR